MCVCVRACDLHQRCHKYDHSLNVQSPTHYQYVLDGVTYNQLMATTPMPIIMNAAAAPHNLYGDMS